MSERLSCFWTNIDIIKMQMQFGGGGDREKSLSWYAHRYRRTEGESHTQPLTENTQSETLHVDIANDDKGLELIRCWAENYWGPCKWVFVLSLWTHCCACLYVCVPTDAHTYRHTNTLCSLGFRLPSLWPLLRAIVWWEKEPAFTPGPGRSLGSG